MRRIEFIFPAKENCRELLTLTQACCLSCSRETDLCGVSSNMPIYEYECASCCNVFEVIQRMTEDPLTTCPECSGKVKKLVSKSSFQLKGGGWYADGYSSTPSNGSGSGAADKAVKSSTKTTSSSKEKSASSSGTKKESSTAAA